MAVLEDLAGLSAAEEFFRYLNVPYDMQVVQVARLHILRRMGQYIRGSEVEGVFDGLSDDEVRGLCAEHLTQAYDDFVKSSPIAERIFKVHKEAVEQKAGPSKPFVPLATLGGADKAE